VNFEICFIMKTWLIGCDERISLKRILFYFSIFRLQCSRWLIIGCLFHSVDETQENKAYSATCQQILW